jgi:hypothetical protein
MASTAGSRVISEAVAVRCTECGREVDELLTIAERWTWWSDEYGTFCRSALCAPGASSDSE